MLLVRSCNLLEARRVISPYNKIHWFNVRGCRFLNDVMLHAFYVIGPHLQKLTCIYIYIYIYSIRSAIPHQPIRGKFPVWLLGRGIANLRKSGILWTRSGHNWDVQASVLGHPTFNPKLSARSIILEVRGEREIHTDLPHKMITTNHKYLVQPEFSFKYPHPR